MPAYIVNGLKWVFYYDAGPDWLGFIPDIILATDARPVAEQVAERYAHGGGWKPFNKFTTGVGPDNRTVLQYPGDPPLLMLATCRHPLTNEQICLFESAWIMVIQPDGSHAISRMD